jgi:rhodanese-related sulfurtransferase
MSESQYEGDITPADAWNILEQNPRAVLIDVRTPAEWNYVGVPDLSRLRKQPLFVPWIDFPSMQINSGFTRQIADACTDVEAPLLFLCRSGVRSKAAAIACTGIGFVACYNIDTGFEGFHDAQRHRGTVNGWKASGLPWVQG